MLKTVVKKKPRLKHVFYFMSRFSSAMCVISAEIQNEKEKGKTPEEEGRGK